jgi:hypothetical protein
MSTIADVVYLPLSEIEVNEWNPNLMEQRAFDRLLKEIRNSGFVSAIQVVKLSNGKHRIIGGEHRYRAAKVLDYDEIPCVILSAAEFQDEDVQKFMTVKLNMMSGELDPDKFRMLYEEMAEKYGSDSLEDLFGFTDEDQWRMITKAIGRELKDAGISSDKISKAINALETGSIDGLSKILNEIFSENSDTLKNLGFMSFKFQDSEMIFVDVSRDVFKYMDEIQINAEPAQLQNELFNFFSGLLQIEGDVNAV